MPRRKKLVLYSSPIALLLVLMAWGHFKIERLEHGAKNLAETGTAAIKLLKEVGEGIKTHDLDRVMASYAESYANEQQGPWREELQSDRDGIRVYAWTRGQPRRFLKADLREQISAQLDDIQSLDMAKFKLDAVEEIVSDEEARVRAILWLRGNRAEDGNGAQDGSAGIQDAPEVFESQISFRLTLRKADTGWQIHRQTLLQGETVTGRRHGFVDVADKAGIDYVAQRNPLFSTPEWEPKAFGIIKYGSAGVSASDVDDDGWYDLFFADGRSPRLYRNLGPDVEGAVKFRDITGASGLPTEKHGVNVGLFLDLDNDGDKDLLLGRFMEGNMLFRNDGVDADGVVQFTDVSAQANLGRHFVVVASAADYDNDGDLDLYLGRYLDPRKNLPTTLFYTRNGEGNSLLRNDGNLQFTDVTEQAGVREGGLTLGVAWADFDQDGDSDLYVANDFGRNALLRNDGPDSSGAVRFADISEASGTLDFGFGMSAAWGDIDNDLDLDLYISNVHSGQRWYGQSATLYQYLLTSIKQGTFVEDYPLYKEIFGYAGADWQHYGDGMVKGNSLLVNDGNGGFTDVAEKARGNPFGWYWASAFFDYDNDGKQDVYAANGWISGRTYDDL